MAIVAIYNKRAEMSETAPEMNKWTIWEYFYLKSFELMVLIQNDIKGVSVNIEYADFSISAPWLYKRTVVLPPSS